MSDIRYMLDRTQLYRSTPTGKSHLGVTLTLSTYTVSTSSSGFWNLVPRHYRIILHHEYSCTRVNLRGVLCGKPKIILEIIFREHLDQNIIGFFAIMNIVIITLTLLLVALGLYETGLVTISGDQFIRVPFVIFLLVFLLVYNKRFFLLGFSSVLQNLMGTIFLQHWR